MTLRKLIVAGIMFCTLGLTLMVPTMVSAAPRPAGAIKLPAAKQKKIGSIRCGKVGASWLPGAVIKGGYFVTHTQQFKNFSKAAARKKGTAAKRLRTQAKAYQSKARSQLASCRKAAVPATTPLRFNFSGAVALAKGGSATTASRRASGAASTASSNVSAVLPSGQLRDAVVSGSVSVSDFYVAPNGKIYVVFAYPVNLDNVGAAGSSCLLAQIDAASGIPACVDSTITSVTWKTKNPPIQFDAQGGIFYLGKANGKDVLRRSVDGVVTDLVNADNISFTSIMGDADFLALPDGSALLSGMTMATYAQWVRRILPTGGIQTIASAVPGFMKFFPDGNVYMGMYGANDDVGIKRYLTATNRVDDRYWLTSNVNGIQRDGYFSSDVFCQGADWQTNSAFCQMVGVGVRKFFTNSDNVVVGQLGGIQGAGLFEYFPAVRALTTSLKGISIAEGAGNRIILAGITNSGANSLVVHDTLTGAETPLLSSGDEIEIYHLSYRPSTDQILFDGLRFSDNKVVIGQVGLSSGVVSLNASSAAKFSDFQSLN